MKTTTAQRLRFGILAARHMLERDRLTGWQVDDLEGMEAVGWRIGRYGTVKAMNREIDNWMRR